MTNINVIHDFCSMNLELLLKRIHSFCCYLYHIITHRYIPNKKKGSTPSKSNYLACLNSNENLIFKGAWQLGASYSSLLRGSAAIVHPGDDYAILESFTNCKNGIWKLLFLM